MVGKFGDGDSCSHPTELPHTHRVNLDDTFAPYWHFNIEHWNLLCHFFQPPGYCCLCYLWCWCNDFIGRLHAVTMWLISTIWTPVDDSTILQQFAICYEGVLHFTLVMHYSYFSLTICWIWEVCWIAYILVKCSFCQFLKLWSWIIGELTYLFTAARNCSHFALLSLCSAFRE